MNHSLTIEARPVPSQARGSARAETLGSSTLWMAALITAYFYCLPLGRYQIAGFGSDFRIYDYIFPLALAFNLRYVPRAIAAMRDKKRFFYWARIVVIISCLSLTMTAYYGGFDLLLPATIRAYRWTAYLLVPALIFAIVTNPRRHQFLVRVLYVNIAVQAFLAFFQGLGVLPHLWPEYWRASYRTPSGEFPVGTLSAHHKHIGVVMLIGVALSTTYIRTARVMVLKALYVCVMIIMVIAAVFAGSRTAWLGLVVFIVAYFYAHRHRALPVVFVMALAGTAFWIGIKGHVEDPLSEQLNDRFAERIDRFGFAGIAHDRTQIYFDDIPSAIEHTPIIAITGAGFQGISAFLQSTGAHNNYLQALFELGVIGFVFYMRFLIEIARTVKEAARRALGSFERALAADSWALFLGILATMLVGETLWAQYSMFTLSGQIMAAMALAVCPLNWVAKAKENEPKNLDTIRR